MIHSRPYPVTSPAGVQPARRKTVRMATLAGSVGPRHTRLEASWLIIVDGGRIPTGGLAGLSQRLNAAVAAWQGNQSLGGLQVTTGLPQTLSALASSLVVARSLLLIGSLQLLLLATAAAALAARLLASQRASETALMSARGAARARPCRAAGWSRSPRASPPPERSACSSWCSLSCPAPAPGR
jgi:hypothetical protein